MKLSLRIPLTCSGLIDELPIQREQSPPPVTNRDMASVPITPKAERARRLIPFGVVAALAFLLLPSELRTPNEAAIAIAAAFAAAIATAELLVQRLVRQLKQRSEDAERRAAELAAAERRINEQATNLATVVEATREFAAVQSPELVRQRICEAATAIARADIAIFFEPQAGGTALRVTASTDPKMIGMRASLIGETSGAAASYTSAQRLFAPLASAHPMLSRRLVDATGAQSALFQPVIRDGATVAVLGLVWHELHPYLGERRMSLVELLANEAAHAIEHARFVSRLAELARTDELTGLPNRREWDRTLPRELAGARRTDRPLTVAIIDLDEFKDYNDRRGHQAGDRLLKLAAAAWQAELRAADVLARYGGEEFVLALPDCAIDAAVELAERLRAAMPEGETCSIGLAQWNGREPGESLVRRTDAALYKAKKTGRDRAVVSNWLPATRCA